MYKLSTDYARLFALLCQGQIAVGFVNYDIGGDKPARDVCMIKRRGPFGIFLGVRGTSYGGIYPFMERMGLPEEEIFIRDCQMTGLEWIEPMDNSI